MRDFAHMHDEGYELMAEIIFGHLRRQGLVKGMESARLAALTKKFWTARPRIVRRGGGKGKRQ